MHPSGSRSNHIQSPNSERVSAMSGSSKIMATQQAVELPVTNAMPFRQTADTPLEAAISRYTDQSDGSPRGHRLTPHLRRLEAESIEIMREVVAQFRNPVFLYSIGKD